MIDEAMTEGERKPGKDERTWGMLCHVAAFAGWFGNGIGWIVGPLIVWLIKRDEYPYVDQQGKNVLNFQISMFIWILISILLCFIFIGFILLFLLGIAQIVLTIIGAVKANNGEEWSYPLSIKFFK